MTDHAKELLALADRLDAWIGPVSSGYEVPAAGQAMREAATALRLSARQQASVEWERLTSIIRPLIESVCSDGGSDAARLAKAISDIFEKVEG